MKPIQTHQSCCRLGIARTDITPPVGMYHRMWGAAVHDRSEGIHRPLTATAMTFASMGSGTDRDGKVLIAIDHCLLGPTEVAAICSETARLNRLAVQDVILTFSHTHAAGLLNLDRSDQPGGELIAGYLEALGTKIAGLVADSLQSRQEANIVYGTGRCDLAAHRDLWDPALGDYVCGFNPAENADDTMMVARITDLNGALLGTIVNYACHPTTLAWQNRLISPDFPGAARETVERHVGGTCVFLQGASGELGPVEGFVGDPEVADRNGRQLGFAALSALEALPPPDTVFTYTGRVVSGASIGTWDRQAVDGTRKSDCQTWATACDPISLAFRQDLPTMHDVQQRLTELLEHERAAEIAGDGTQAVRYRALVERERRMQSRLQALGATPDFSFQTSVWRMGDAVWVAVQGEPYSKLQTELRRRFPDVPLVISVLANGWGPSYLPPREVYGRGIYQESIAVLAPGCLEQVIDTIGNRIRVLYENHRN